MIVVTQCPHCKRKFSHTISEEQYKQLIAGVDLMMIFPDMGADEREMFITGICPECWDAIFADSEEVEPEEFEDNLM